MRISDWSSDVCSSDLETGRGSNSGGWNSCRQAGDRSTIAGNGRLGKYSTGGRRPGKAVRLYMVPAHDALRADRILVLCAQFDRDGIDRHRDRYRFQGAAAFARMGDTALRQLAPDLERVVYGPFLRRTRLYAAQDGRWLCRRRGG